MQVVVKIGLIPFISGSIVVPIWKLASNGEFSKKSLWECMIKMARVQEVIARSLGSRVPTNVAIFWCKLLNGWLPVEDVLQSTG